MISLKMPKNESSAYYDSAQPILSVYNAGKLLSQFYLQDIHMDALQRRLDDLKTVPMVETSGVSHNHHHICHDIVYNDQEFKYYLNMGFKQYPIREDAIGTVLFAKYMADSMIIPATVNAIAGIDFNISETGEVYIAWPTLEEYY